MIDTELRIKVAELAGWGQISSVAHELRGMTPDRTHPSFMAWTIVVPEYANDLNAIHKAINSLRSLPGPEYHDFNARLIDVCGSIGNAINADARTRAEVYVEVMNGKS
jgi:hypothetical protein